MRIVLLLVTALVLSSNATAQQQRPQLQVLIEDLDEDAAKCGVAKSQLESIAALTLRNNGIQAVNELTNPHLYVVATFLLTAGGASCAYHTGVAVRGFSRSDDAMRPLGAFKARGISNTVLCQQGTLSTTAQARTTMNMTQVLENMIKLCLGGLDY